MSKPKQTRKRTPAKAPDAAQNGGIGELPPEVSPEAVGEVAPEARPLDAEPSAEGPEPAQLDRAVAQIRRIEEPVEQLFVSKYYEAFPRQKEFHESKAKYRLFGGAAGPGKTTALLWEAIRQANEHPKVDTLLLRRTFPELESTLISQFRRDVPRNTYKSYNDGKHVVTWLNGSTTRFGYSAGENDIYQYQGAEFLFIGIDELTLFTLGQWQFLTSRNRCAVPDTFPNMAGATNPGNVGHAWVKALWVDKRPAPGMDRAEQYDPRDYHFIRATLDDNPIYKDDRQYHKALDALPRHMRQAFLLGDWNVFAGQYFDLFDLHRHTARAEQLGRDRDAQGNLHGDGLASWWPRWISIDWGFEHPSAVYWHAISPGGTVITYREFVANHLSPRMLGQAIAERSIGFYGSGPGPVTQGQSVTPGGESTRSPSSPMGDAHMGAAREHISEIFLSPDAFAHRTSESSIAEQLGDVLAQNGLPRPVPADDDRVGGWMLIYQMLEEGKWVIADNCARLIECIPTLVRDPANVEDVQKMPGDDPCLTGGTLVQCRHGLVPIENVKAGDHVLTRKGWREVLWSGMTSSHARLLGVRLSNGATLVGTANHLLSLGNRWVRLDRARYGDRLVGCTKKQSSIGDVAIGVIRALRSVLIALTSLPPVSGEIAYCTATFGKTLTGPSPQGITFITSMAIHSTTVSVTSNASRHGSIWLSIRRPLKNCVLRARGVWIWLDRKLHFGTNPKKEESLPSEYLPNSCVCEENAGNAGSAESHFGGCRGVSSVPMRVSLAGAAKWVSIISKSIVSAAVRFLSPIVTSEYDFVPVYVLDVTEEVPGPVYNLTVQGEPEFFANGVLVHNCDSARYGLKSRLAPGRIPREQRAAERLDAAGTLDMTSRAIWMRKFMADEQRSRRAAPLPHRW